MFLASVLCIGLAASVAAGPLEDGLAADKRGDHARALRLWRPLAEQGNPRAQNNLGEMYRNGHGVPQDYVEAMRWYRKAADRGHAFAQANLGAMYANGDGVPQDYAEAARWFRKAADQGHATAQYNLGVVYANGWGVRRTYVQAHMWFSLAAAQASRPDTRDTANGWRDAVAAKMTAAQIAEAERLAREWKPK